MVNVKKDLISYGRSRYGNLSRLAANTLVDDVWQEDEQQGVNGQGEKHQGLVRKIFSHEHIMGCASEER